MLVACLVVVVVCAGDACAKFNADVCLVLNISGAKHTPEVCDAQQSSVFDVMMAQLSPQLSQPAQIVSTMWLRCR